MAIVTDVIGVQMKLVLLTFRQDTEVLFKAFMCKFRNHVSNEVTHRSYLQVEQLYSLENSVVTVLRH